MKPLKIYLSPFAYYVRVNLEKFEEIQKKGSLEKLFDNGKGMLPYEFIEFKSLDKLFDFPKKVKKMGLRGSNALCYHPFNYKTSASTRIFEPIKIILESDNKVHFLFEEGQSSGLHFYEKYYTKEGQPFITKISFYIDESNSNLYEQVYYSDNSEKTSDYHLISKTTYLQKPEYYALFDFD